MQDPPGGHLASDADIRSHCVKAQIRNTSQPCTIQWLQRADRGVCRQEELIVKFDDRSLRSGIKRSNIFDGGQTPPLHWLPSLAAFAPPTNPSAASVSTSRGRVSPADWRNHANADREHPVSSEKKTSRLEK